MPFYVMYMHFDAIACCDRDAAQQRGETMKKIATQRVLVSAVLAAWVLAFGVTALAGTNDIPIGTEASLIKEIPLSSKGQPKAALIIPANASDIETNASVELKKFLDQITGGNFRVQKDNEKIAGSYISIGNTIQMQKAGFAELPAKLGDEGIAVQLYGGNIFLVGGTKGIMHAVMSFLEDDLGCRWYSDKWEFIPKDENMKATVRNRISIPDFTQRFVFSAHEMTNNPEWVRHNRVMKWNLFGHVDGWFCHTYENICPKTDFSKHPELFSKDKEGKPSKGQLCPVHPEVIKRAQERVFAALKNNKREDVSLVSIAEFDADEKDYCHCEKCEDLVKKHNSTLAPHMSLVNEVARYIQKDFPDIKVDFIVYAHEGVRFRKAPVDFKVEQNVAVWYCANNLAHHEIFRNKQQLVDEFRDWKKLIKTVNIWEYGCDYQKYFRVDPSLHAKVENLKFWKTQGVDGIMFQEVFGAVGGDQQALRAWVLSKMLWNSKLDQDKLALDFCEGVFGNVAPEMFEYYQLVNRAGVAEKSIEEYYGESEFVDRANRIFAKAFAKTTDAELRQRIEVHYVPILFMEIDSLFRAYPSNKSNFPLNRYRLLLREFKKITKREKMNMHDEVRGLAGYIHELELLLNVASKGGVLSISSIHGMNYAYPTRKDPLATNGLASRLVCDGRWLVQWHFPANLCIPGKKYQIRAQIRVEKKSLPEDVVAIAGVYSKENEKVSFMIDIKDKQLSSTEYRWIAIGEPFSPKDKEYIWFAAKADSKIGALYIDKIEMVPHVPYPSKAAR